MVVVSNGVTFERVSDAEVVVVTDSDREKYAQDTNEDGIASFSFQGPERLFLIIIILRNIFIVGMIIVFQ